MNQRVFAGLAHWLQRGDAVVLASVLGTRGAVPRQVGSRMLISASATAFSVGGGQLEAQAIEAARALLRSDQSSQQLQISLSGGNDSAGICGGWMRIGLRRWQGAADRQRVTALQDRLSTGQSCTLSGAEQGGETLDEATLEPDPRLLIIGAGHCGQALCRAAAALDFEIWVHDARHEHCRPEHFPAAAQVSRDLALLDRATDSDRALYAVLLNRDYQADVLALQRLLPLNPAYIGMMGSRRRIAQVRGDPQLATQATALQRIHAPIGLAIAAQTPEEIAISILAELIALRRRAVAAATA